MPPLFTSYRAILGAAGSSKTTVIIVTEGTVAFVFNYYGYNGDTGIVPSFGSIDISTLNNAVIERISWNDIGSPGNHFQVHLAGNLAQNFFESVTPQGGSELLTSSLYAFSYNSGDNISQWGWDSDPSGWDGSGTSTATFTY